MLANVPRETLLEKLKTNRAGHRALYEEAYDIYCKKLIEEIEESLAAAKNKKNVRMFSSLPVPEDHTDSYDNIIALLEMSTDETVELDDDDTKRYILDKWEWERSFGANTVAYVSKRM